jgi:hypothetical protein
MSAKDLANQLITRAKNMQEFTVLRDFEDIVFNGGVVPFTINHCVGEQARIIVPAVSREEAEQQVDVWLRGQRAWLM